MADACLPLERASGGGGVNRRSDRQRRAALAFPSDCKHVASGLLSPQYSWSLGVLSGAAGWLSGCRLADPMRTGLRRGTVTRMGVNGLRPARRGQAAHSPDRAVALMIARRGAG